MTDSRNVVLLLLLLWLLLPSFFFFWGGGEYRRIQIDWGRQGALLLFNERKRRENSGILINSASVLYRLKDVRASCDSLLHGSGSLRKNNKNMSYFGAHISCYLSL